MLRKKNFKRSRDISEKRTGSLDEYIDFLMQIQKVSPFVYDKKKPITAFNKL